ncbi:hypothetical protein [Streptomyces viridosporus]|uniref:hypothetical protein n=1 Tax=Streptomyces viridosporus TaxID=67581 RepID=UPI003323D755
MTRIRLWPGRRGTLTATFTAASTDDDFRFDVHAEGKWHTTRRHHNPAAAATCHVIEETKRLAAECSILAAPELQYRANALLGRPTLLPESTVRLDWARVHVHVDPEDQHAAHTRLRLRARAQTQWELRQMTITQAETYRDQLREDPNLLLAQLILHSPQAITQQTLELIPQIAQSVAAYAPGASWVQTALLLDKWFADLPTDAKRFIIDRLCTTVTEFGGEAVAQRLRSAHAASASPSHSAWAEGSDCGLVGLNDHDHGTGTDQSTPVAIRQPPWPRPPSG